MRKTCSALLLILTITRTTQKSSQTCADLILALLTFIKPLLVHISGARIFWFNPCPQIYYSFLFILFLLLFLPGMLSSFLPTQIQDPSLKTFPAHSDLFLLFSSQSVSCSNIHSWSLWAQSRAHTHITPKWGQRPFPPLHPGHTSIVSHFNPTEQRQSSRETLLVMPS